MEKEVKRNRKNICCFSSRIVDKTVLEHTPTLEEKIERGRAKCVVDSIIKRQKANPVKFWRNKSGVLCFVSMKTANGLKI